MQDGEEADHRIEGGRRQRKAERVAAEVGHTVAEPAAAREIAAHLVELGLQLEGGDVASRGVREKARRTADARPDVENATGRAELQETGRGRNGVGPVV